VLAALILTANLAVAGSFINANGSDEGIAIQGYDTVTFFTKKEAVKGKAEFAYERLGAKWLFASQENLTLFKENPEKYSPEYGGHFARCVSENCISKKPFAGYFDIVNGKLYLFGIGNRSRNSARIAWWRTVGGPGRRIPDGDKN
jgi:YHS domain-containing protein